jgi:hypothetical protein
VNGHELYTPEAHTYEVHAHEGFCEDLARQNTVAHLSQLRLGFLGRCTVCLGTSAHRPCFDLSAFNLCIVASRPRFGCYSRGRTPQLVWTGWRETQLGRNQLERHSWTGASYSHESGTRPTAFSYVYKYLLVPQVE